MSIAVLHVNKSSPNSTSPTMRIAKYVAGQIPGAAFVYDVPTAQAALSTKFDVVFVKYGLLAFSDHRKEAIEILNNAKRVINLENDYSFEADKRLRKADETWSTVTGRTRYCNWNVLTRHGTEGWEKRRDFRAVTNKGLLYYGAHRPGRVKYFQTYMRHAPYPVTISSFRGEKDFGVTCAMGEGMVRLMPAFRDPDAPSEWEMTVYIEDEASHNLYCSPANRFYECLHMGLPQAIDENAVHTLRQAGFGRLERFSVRTKFDVRKMLVRWDEIRDMQQNLWRRNYAADLHEQFHTAMRESKI